jgi:hypothetical protein
MPTVNGTVQQKVDFGQASVGTPVSYSLKGESPNLTRSYAPGTAAGCVDQLHAKVYALVAAATTLDLTALPGVDGTNFSAARCREFYIRNLSTFVLTVGNAAATAWTGAGCPIGTATGTFAVPPGGIFLWSDPSTVGAGNGGIIDATHKSLKFDPGANNVSFELIMACCSAVS